MKAISLWQPWASAIANGVKTIETRSWQPNYFGPIAIHASQKRSGELAAIFDGLLGDHPEILRAFVDVAEDNYQLLPFGAVIATARIQAYGDIDMFSSISETERALGDYSAGRFGWQFVDVKKLPQPIPAIGRQRFFNVNI